MQRALFCLLVGFCFFQATELKSQSLTIQTLETFYGVNPDHHLIGLNKRFSSGFGLTGFATITAKNPSGYSDKFFIGPSYTVQDFASTRWSASISPGIYTTGIFYNFPKYPLNYGIASAVNYKITDAYAIRLGLNFNKESSFNSGVIGFKYNLGETFIKSKTDSASNQKLYLSVTYGFNPNGHIFLLETFFSNNLGLHAVTLSDALHPSSGMVDRYYIGPAINIKDDMLGKFDLSFSLGIYTSRLLYNFPNYPILPASHFKIDYNWKPKLAVACGFLSLPLDSEFYAYLGLCYSI